MPLEINPTVDYVFKWLVGDLQNSDLAKMLPEPAVKKAAGLPGLISRIAERLRHDLRLNAIRGRFPEPEYNLTVARQEGLAEGHEESVRLGLIRLLRGFQSLAKESALAGAEMATLSADDLTCRIQQLQAKPGVSGSNRI